MSSQDGGAKAKRPVRILKERMGGTRPEVTERNRRHRKLGKAIRTVLAERSRTVPELAIATETPAHEVLWMLMAMKKYGAISEGEERDGYHEYALLAREAEK